MDRSPMEEIAAAYGVKTKGWDAITVAEVIQRRLPDDVWEKLPDKSQRFRLLNRNVRQGAVTYVLHPLVTHPDSFESLKAGRPIANDVKEMMDAIVAAVGFPDGGADEFVDAVLANIAAHL